MTMFTPEAETPRWQAIPQLLPPRTRPPALTTGRPGIVEIKPHTETGILKGVANVRRALLAAPNNVGLLVTYYAVDDRDQPKTSGQAAYAHLFAALITTGPNDTPRQYLSANRWRHLGRITVPQTIPHPRVNQISAFGQAIEPAARAKVRDVMRTWIPGITFQRATGGHRPGPDIIWSELAELYAELARELRDPLYAELANELTALAEGGWPYGSAA
jgi:hypothetical protein